MGRAKGVEFPFQLFLGNSKMGNGKPGEHLLDVNRLEHGTQVAVGCGRKRREAVLDDDPDIDRQ